MPYMLGTANSPAYLCSTEWVCDLVAADLDVESAAATRLDDFLLHVDLGGMISTYGTPKVSIDHEDGRFHFYIHHRSEIRAMLEKAIAKAGRDEYVTLNSAHHILCITPEHALHLLLGMEQEGFDEQEEKARAVCREMVNVVRNEPMMVLSSEHDLNAN